MTDLSPDWLARLDRWLAAHRPSYLARLAPGASIDAVAGMPAGLAALYRWHDGQVHSGDSFLVRHWFMPLAQARAQQRDIAKDRDADGYGPEWWSDDWLPFLDDGQGNLTCLDATSGKVLLYFGDSEERNDLAPSLDVFFGTLVDALEAGHFRLDDEGRAVVADEAAFQTLVRSRGVCFDAFGY
jgi:cell wall assembly regulator SMI1